jgi:hypothetical protein
MAMLWWVGGAAAQLGDPEGPGQAVPAPQAQCPRTIACTYAEHNPQGASSAYRLQALQVCGANCATQYWVVNAADGRVLLTVDPVRGGAIVALARGSGPDDARPGIRIIVPSYTPTDAMCCPSTYLDRTYHWDATQNALVLGPEMAFPASAFPGWDGLRTMLEREGWSEVFRGL